MEKVDGVLHNDTGGSSHDSQRSGDGSQAAENPGSDDPPPIPRASSSGLMHDLSKDEARSKYSESLLTVTATNIESMHDLPCRDIAHMVPVSQVLATLNTTVDGLTTSEVVTRQIEHGVNRLETFKGATWKSILVRQVSNSLTIVLAIAMILSYATLDFIEGGVISAVILLNIVVGFYQDYRAEQTIQSLRALAAPSCRVVRDGGKQCTIKAEEVTLGDVISLSVGDVVCADMRLIECVNFASDEALLTGESRPRTKDAQKLVNYDAPLGDRDNMAYASTVITRGRATGVVVAIGMTTEIGKIALLLRDKKIVRGNSRGAKLLWRAINGLKGVLGLVGTPSQVKLSYFGLLLFGLAIVLAIIVFSAAAWDIDNETLIYGICVAVAVIPESLIAVVTIVMAVGSQTMARGNVIVRKMSALEAIGGVTNVCSDKTGTLTQGKMLVRKIWLPDDRRVTIVDEAGPFDPTIGRIMVDGISVNEQLVSDDMVLNRLFSIAGLCNVAKLEPPNGGPGKGAVWSAIGEPTEIALQVLATRVGFSRSLLEDRMQLRLIWEHSFDSAAKRMSVIFTSVQTSEQKFCFVKGATEVLLPRLVNLTIREQQHILEQAEAMASEGLRVLCLAYRDISEHEQIDLEDRDSIEHNLTIAGLVGIYDPPRVESARAIQQCRAAGIEVHMLTGDHLQTATTIAKEIGILSHRPQGASSCSTVMTAAAFDALTEKELDDMLTLPLVLARCTPATKLRMLEALHRRGKYCVMTGDGVNDSPALKGADVGVAMGMNGSDVSKEAADMVLTDDNFASIVTAIREGRRLFDNIQKFLLHLLVSNIAQVILLLIGLAFQDTAGNSIFPLSPLEILFANLVTSSFLAIGLGLEKPSADVMSRPPHSLKAGVFTKELIIDKFIYGTFMGILCLASYMIVLLGVGNGDLGHDCNHSYNGSCDIVYRARGTAYAVLTVLLSVMAWEAKHLTRSLFNMYPEEDGGSFSVLRTIRRNRFLFWAVIVGLLTPFASVYIPVINIVVFRHKALKWEWGLVGASLVSFVALVETWKAVKRTRIRWGRTRSEKEQA